jgi:hypothetical protein
MIGGEGECLLARETFRRMIGSHRRLYSKGFQSFLRSAQIGRRVGNIAVSGLYIGKCETLSGSIRAKHLVTRLMAYKAATGAVFG